MVDWAMSDANDLQRQALISGAVASVLSAAVLVLCGQIENRRPAGPLNGPSQWVFGRWAARMREPSLRHTLTGFLIHHVSATGWAVLHERILGKNKARQTFPARLGRAALTSAAANFVDFQLTPKRLRPGFETQLSRKSLFAVYAAFAIGLALVAPRERAAKVLAPDSTE
ncbi:MAG TPA: hypothetical protein VFU13_15080 [Steroidobacteraceae bacterium]|nr:hypothetical protein [Steroidobacteraceae bacterium]